jgi:hypothetical protein
MRPELLGDPKGVHVRFDYGFGTNVHIVLNEHRQLVMSIGGWEKLCGLIDEYRSLVDPEMDTHEQMETGKPELEKQITVSEKRQLTNDEGAGQWVEETPLYLYSDGSLRWKP